MTDTLGPEFPQIPEPGEAAFGVIGLDRVVTWHADPAGLTALQAAAAEPAATRNLAERFGLDLIRDLESRGWLQDPDLLCRDYTLRTGQIEVTAHCNWGCSYCPVSVDPKPKSTMPMDLFTEIIEKLQPHRDIRYVTFHFFNEPTLDKHFTERIEVLSRYGMKLSLSSNASALTAAKTRQLIDSGVMHHLVVNLPSLHEAEFASLTAASTYQQSLRNLDEAISAEKFPITIAVNGVGESVSRRFGELAARYEPRGVEVVATQTCDRAGALDNEYHQDIKVDGRLRGCSWPLNHAYFSVAGDMFICCNDYYQRETFGNIRDGSVHEIMTSAEAVRLRRRVFGVEDAPDDYICRTCHDQKPDFVHRQFRPLASFPLEVVGADPCRAGNGCGR
ncbi:radical SAM/SPASM domain-containing protein [Nocardia gamkensis]|nr:radical SAM/SPASM domain-containing protein [Nocardia gamkensis]